MCELIAAILGSAADFRGLQHAVQVHEAVVYGPRPLDPSRKADQRTTFEILTTAVFAFVDAILSFIDFSVFTVSASNNLEKVFVSLRSSGPEWCVHVRCE